MREVADKMRANNTVIPTICCSRISHEPDHSC